MKLSTILITLAEARLPSVTAEQLQQLVGTAEGKAFADDVRWLGAGDATRRSNVAAVVYCLAPGVRRSVERLGLQFDLLALVGAVKRDGEQLLEAIKSGGASNGGRGQLVAYLRGVGLKAAPSPTPAQSAPAEPPYYSFKIFSSTAALCVAEATTRAERKHTINIEGAVALVSSGGRKAFDWANKIVVQLTVQEAYLVLALLENKIRSLRFDGHGTKHDKSLQVEFQESHYYFRLTQRGRAAVAVPIRAVDSIQIVSLLYRQLLANEPHLQIEDMRTMVDRIAKMTLPP